MTRAPSAAGQRGMSLVEVMILALVISTLMVVMTESMATLSSVRIEQKAHFRLGDVADHVARRMQEDVRLAARVFGNSADDLDYFRSMAVGPGLLRTGARLPSVTQNGYFRPDAPTVDETGNVLFTALRGPKVQVQFDRGGTRLVQSLQFSVCAPVEDGQALDLVRWQSQPVVHYFDLMEIADPEDRADALQQLTASGVHLAWDPYGRRSGALFEIVGSSLQPLPADRLVPGREDPADSRPFGQRRMRLPRNGSLPGVAIPAYARAASGFDGAFEIKIDGSTSGKLVLLRFVVDSTLPGLKRPVWSEIRRFLPTNG